MKEKQALSSIINLQSSAGNWKSESRDTLVSCLDGEELFEDADVMQALNALELKEGADKSLIYLTLLALFILEEAYWDEKQSWTMIATKAKKYL